MIIYSYRDDLSTDCLLFCGKCYKFEMNTNDVTAAATVLLLLIFSTIYSQRKFNW